MCVSPLPISHIYMNNLKTYSSLGVKANVETGFPIKAIRISYRSEIGEEVWDYSDIFSFCSLYI